MTGVRTLNQMQGRASHSADPTWFAAKSSSSSSCQGVGGTQFLLAFALMLSTAFCSFAFEVISGAATLLHRIVGFIDWVTHFRV